MLVQAEKVFLTASPLSELVWSPRKGLCLKCTDSSAAENGSLWWNTESFNVIATGPEYNIGEESSDNGMLQEKGLNSPPASIVEIVTACPTMTHEQNSTNNASEASSEEIERFPGRNEVSQAEANSEENMPLEQTKVSGPSLGHSQRNSASAINTTDKVPSKGCDDAKAAGSLSSNPVQMVMDHAKSNKVLPENAEDSERRDSHASDLAEGLVLRCNTSGKSVSHLQYIDDKQSGNGSDAKEDDAKHPMHPQLTYFYPLGQRSHLNDTSQHEEISFLRSFAGCGGEAADTVALEPTEDIKGETPNMPLQFKGISGTKEETGKIAKGKEKIDEFGEGANVGKNKENNHGCKEMDDGRESVKGSNGKEFSTSKRVWSFESNESSSKKLKQLNHESSADVTLPTQDSSFLNWMSGFAKVLPSSIQSEMPMTLVLKNAQSKPSNPCPPLSLNESGDLLANRVGCQSFIQTLHYPKSVMQQIVTGNANNLNTDIHSNELEMPNMQSANASGNAFSTKLNLHKPVPLATLGLRKWQPEEMFPLDGINFVSGFHAQGKQEHIGMDNQCICNSGSSSSSVRIASTDPEKTAAGKPDTIVHGSDALVVSSGSDFLGSFWITRLCSKPPSFSSTSQVNQALASITGMQLDCRNLYLPHLQNDNKPVEGNKCFGNVGMLPIEVQKDAIRNEHSPNHSDSSSKGVTVDNKPNTKLNPIVPSERIKRLETIASVFAKRLDAFRHITSSNIVNDVLYSASTCLFCGQTGHSMKDCTQVVGTELESLQKNLNSYGGPKDSACLCIRCFQLNHWAITCPYSSRKANSPSDGLPYAAAFNFERIDEQPANDVFKRSDKNHKEHPKNLATHYVGVEDVKSSHPKLIKDFPGESHFKGKTVLTSTIHSEARGTQVIPGYGFAKRKVFDQQTRIFEGIRGLHLSRTDLVRLMRSPISGLNLEGFFLRVRLGKQEEIPEGSGYQVACINGVPEGRSFGTTKNYIPVNIGGFKCLLDCRFVSNNDFSEDELNSWWSAVSRTDSKPPTEEQLMRKLKERGKFGI